MPSAISGPVFVAVDAGTSGARAAAVDASGRVVAEARRPYPTTTPQPGFTEQDPRDWEARAVEALALLAHRLAGRAEVAAIGLTGQCPTIAPYDAKGRPVGPGVLYLDNRSVAEADELRGLMPEADWHRRTGQVPEAFYAGPTMLWLRRHEPAVFARTHRFLQPRDAVLRRLTGIEATDQSHAGTTLFFDLERREWATDLLDRVGLEPDLLPPILASSEIAGGIPRQVAADVGLKAGTPVVIGAADSLCAAFGAGAGAPGPVSEMAGSSSCINSSIELPPPDPRITLYAHVAHAGYMTELGINTAGAAIDWAVRRFGFANHADLFAEAERFRRRRHRGDACEAAPLFVPYLGDGERDDPAIRGGLVGLSHRHDRAAIAFAAVEGVALALREVLSVLEPYDELRVSGGAARHPLTSQIKADVLARPVVALAGDATAVGCALLAAGATGHGDVVEGALQATLARARRFTPGRARAPAEAERAAWFAAVKSSPALHAAVR
jgi:sugar (pentulose or hexulose) kinase